MIQGGENIFLIFWSVVCGYIAYQMTGDFRLSCISVIIFLMLEFVVTEITSEKKGAHYFKNCLGKTRNTMFQKRDSHELGYI